MNINSVVLAGNLTHDPVLRELPDGSKVCDLRLAVNEGRDRAPLYIDVSVFGASGEAAARYLAKGREVGVTGRLAFREWTSADGVRRNRHSVIGNVSFGRQAETGAGAEPPDADHERARIASEDAAREAEAQLQAMS
jgi:single-strand DNA-binding protein